MSLRKNLKLVRELPALSLAPDPEELPMPLDVRALRRRMKLTQRQFAGMFGFAFATLRHWERGDRRPGGTALVLLHVIAANPRVVLQAVRKMRLALPGTLPAARRLRSGRAPPGGAVPVW